MELSQNPKSKIQNWLLLSLIAVGAVLRFVFQFVTPSFSGDEINLGNNIKHRGFLELLGPLDNFQSAPPMFLWLQKAVISVSPLDFWISIKIVSFVVAVLILIEASRLARSLFENVFAQILFVSFFVFSPSILYHTLTVKQYGFDLLFLLFVLNRFLKLRDTWLGPVVFAIWCLFSNVGLFFVAAMGVYKLISHVRHGGLSKLPAFLLSPKNILLALSPLPYLLYFVWYMRQPGADGIKAYMLDYWQMTFIPLNGRIFEYSAYLFDDVAFYFLSPNRALAYLVFIVAIVGIFPLLTREGDAKRRLAVFLFLGGLVHAVLSAAKMFPVSERLYLYESPLMYLLIISGVTLMCGRYAGMVLGVLALVLGAYNVANIPFKQNDIVGMYRYLRENDITDVTYSDRALRDVRSFNEFTDGALMAEGEAGSVKRETEGREAEIQNPKPKTQNSLYLVSRSHIEFRHQSTQIEEEDDVLFLKRSGRLRLVHKTQGYSLFEVLK